MILTSTNLACNPRCLKEVRLLVSQNIKVTVVAFNLHNWTDDKERLLMEELNGVEFYHLETTSKQMIPWFISSLIEKLFRKIARYFPANTLFQSLGFSKRSWLLLSWSKKWKESADLIIAHNPPAFYPARYLAKKLNIPFALDIEDYHPGEGKNKNEQALVSSLMKKLIPETVYTSYASPLIQAYTEELVGKMDKTKNLTVNNLFSSAEFTETESDLHKSDTLQFVWFSQVIDYGRGLEHILPVLDQFESKIKLTLIGNLRDPFYISEIKMRPYIEVLKPLSQSELNKKISEFDIGLALENVDADLNRSICLTNKIWAYFQAGLYILATETQAQISFLAEHATHGKVMKPDNYEMNIALKDIITNAEEIRSGRKKRYLDASAYSWENESDKLIKKWDSISTTQKSHIDTSI